jgi:phosphatidylglycerophosphate synthase
MPWLDQKHLLSNDMGLPEIIHEVEVSRTGANKWGKIKMVLQVIVISALLLFDPQTSIWIHGKYAFLPDKLTLLHLSFPLLIVCIILGVLSLYGHFQAIQFKKE